MDSHALRVLEFEKVLALLAAETAFSLGRELAMAAAPATDLEGAVRLQSETAEVRYLDQQGIDIPFGGAKDIRDLIRAAAIGQMLAPGDLVDVAGTLRAAWRLHHTLEKLRERVPTLAGIADGACDFRKFTDAVDSSITPRGDVADSASDALGAVRRELRSAQDRLEARAQAALADAIRRGIVQDALLTERNGRKVVPIKSDFRGALPGIVHDVSSSGATLFLEPLAVVEAGNQVRELQVAEDREVRRVLLRLTAMVGEREDEAMASLFALGRLDVVSAKGRLARKLKAELPPPGDPSSWLRAEGETKVVRGRHPLLRGKVVPTDIAVGGATRGVLITGPNTGGKTVALKTLGLLTLMAQAGLPVPCAEDSLFAVYPRVFADIGDEQSIEQSLSTFSSHMRNIIGILEKAEPRTLVLLDELGAGTDPTEGAALARAILETLLERGCTLVATTHHGELKAFAHNDPRLTNANVEFNLETLSPTYHLTIGLPGQSNAIAIAQRLGLKSDVITKAQAQLRPEHFEMEQLLSEIREERATAAEARREAELAKREGEALRLELARRREDIDQERVAILGTAQREAEDILGRYRNELDQLRRRGQQREAPGNGADETLRRLDADLGKLASKARPQRREAVITEVTRQLQPGDTVHVRDIPQRGVALSGIGEDGRVDVQFGSLRMKVSVERIDNVGTVELGTRVTLPEIKISAPPLELDLRGQRAEEALSKFETYLDDAYRSGVPFIRIIHGKGTGALRAAIRDALRGHPLVKSYEGGKIAEGGDGVTVAILAG
ncbi:MAG: endonuclease MutS2 [Dehalococcoidia bacterium]